VLCAQNFARLTQGDARQLQDGTAASCFAGYVHVADMQQLAADAAHLVSGVLRGVEANMLSLALARQQQQHVQPEEQQLIGQQRQRQTAAVMTQQGQQYWERWQQQQQQQPGDVWFPSALVLPQDRYNALLEQVAMVAEVGAAFCLLGWQRLVACLHSSA
jgi:hypothetical protein